MNKTQTNNKNTPKTYKCFRFELQPQNSLECNLEERETIHVYRFVCKVCSETNPNLSLHTKHYLLNHVKRLDCSCSVERTCFNCESKFKLGRNRELYK